MTLEQWDHCLHILFVVLSALAITLSVAIGWHCAGIGRLIWAVIFGPLLYGLATLNYMWWTETTVLSTKDEVP